MAWSSPHAHSPGIVHAGWPSPADEELQDLLSLDEWLLPRKEASVLVRVKSGTMIAAGILPGDTVIVERGRRPCSGDIVIAETEGSWMMRRYFLRGGQPVLAIQEEDASATHPADTCRVIGVVTTVIRQYH